MGRGRGGDVCRYVCRCRGAGGGDEVFDEAMWGRVKGRAPGEMRSFFFFSFFFSPPLPLAA